MNSKWHKVIFVLLLAVMGFTNSACSTDPEEINFGVDQCSLCRMNISEHRFGAEIVTKKGKIFKYDAAECMFNALSLGNVNYNDAAGFYVVDASNPKKLIDGVTASYLISEKLPSPMGANLSAYGKKEDAETNRKQYGGDLKTWEDLLVKFKVGK
ncbi:MAG TPA: nitrous oxide reductase accessory protein NosL [Ignavibacteria bacterium]|nr:nitrous oxide reductase accessory protein NosL [Ignavibacteria bacterium]